MAEECRAFRVDCKSNSAARQRRSNECNERRRGSVHSAKAFQPERAELFLKLLPNLPFEIVTPSLQDILEAAALKARYPISYADAFAAQLALKTERPLVTGDTEFKAIADLELVWLGPDPI